MFQSGSEGRAAQQCAVLTRLISPLLANVALSVLDDHFCAKWDAHTTAYRREAHRKRGGATYRIVRYADDCVPRTRLEVAM
jgi:RNA-directed DNA polymerase